MGCEMRTLVSLVSLKVTMSDVDGTVPGEELSRPPLVCLESLVLGQRQNRPAPCLYILLRYSLKGPTKKLCPAGAYGWPHPSRGQGSLGHITQPSLKTNKKKALLLSFIAPTG